MKQNVMLIIASLLSILFMTFHVTTTSSAGWSQERFLTSLRC